jgi:hypothetical protein
VTPTACKRTVSGSISLPSEGVFSPFPHGTGSLSVTEEYLALRSGLRRFTQNFTCSVLLRILPAASRFHLRGYHPLWLTFPGNSTIYSHTLWKSYNPDMHAYRFGLVPFRSPLLRESHSLSFPPVTEMFHFTGLAQYKIVTRHDSRWVAPFGNLRIIALFQLPEAYRR